MLHPQIQAHFPVALGTDDVLREVSQEDPQITAPGLSPKGILLLDPTLNLTLYSPEAAPAFALQGHTLLPITQD